MADMVYCEFLKLKRSKMCLIALLGTFVTPLLVLILILKTHLSGLDIPLFGFYDSAYVFLMPLFGPLIFSVAAAWLFGREFTEKTLKTIFVVPVAKGKFLMSKFIALFLYVVFMMIVTWAELLVLALLCNVVFEIYNFTIMEALYFLFQMIFAGILLFAVITPVSYAAIRSRGFFAPVLLSAVIALFDVILTASPVAAFFPWTATYLLVTGRIASAGGTAPIAFLIIGTVCFVSIWCSIRRFKKMDLT